MPTLRSVLQVCEAQGMAQSSKAAEKTRRRAKSRRAVLQFVAALEEVANVLEPAIQRMCSRAEKLGDLSECEDAVQYLENQIGEQKMHELFSLLDSFGCRLPDYAKFLLNPGEDEISEILCFSGDDPDEDDGERSPD